MGTFRCDLFYRLNVFPIEGFLLCGKEEKTFRCWSNTSSVISRGKREKASVRINKKTLALLLSYPWPGNIRELQNVGRTFRHRMRNKEFLGG